MLQRIWRRWNNLFAGDIFKRGKVFNLINYTHASITQGGPGFSSRGQGYAYHGSSYMSGQSSWTWHVLSWSCNDIPSRSTRIQCMHVTHDLCVFRWNHGVHNSAGEGIWKRKNEDVRRYVSRDRMHNHSLHNLALNNLIIKSLIATFRYFILLWYWGRFVEQQKLLTFLVYKTSCLYKRKWSSYFSRHIWSFEETVF